MKRGVVFLFLLLIIDSVYAIDLNLALDSNLYSTNQSFNGYLNLSLGQNVSTNSSILALINNNNVSIIKISDFFNANGVNYSVISRNYQFDGDSFSSGSFNIDTMKLFGFSIPSSLATVNQFYINLTGSNVKLKLDVGDDRIFDWALKGERIGLENEVTQNGFSINQTPDSSVDLRGNSIDRFCEDLNLSLNELYDSIDIILYAKAKKIIDGGNLYLSLDTKECDADESLLNNNNYNITSCTVNITNIIDGNYRVCIYSKTGFAGTVYYELPKKFGAVSNFYYLSVRPVKYSDELDGFVSITNEKIKNRFEDYLNRCADTLCIVPIAFYTKGSSTFNIQSVLVRMDSVNKFDRMYKLNSIGDSLSYNGIARLNLNKFNSLRTPLTRGNYSLKLMLNGINSNSIDFSVREIPIARIRVNSERVGLGESFIVDGRDSTSTLGNITNYTWYFGNITKFGAVTNYSFASYGNYTISLIVTDTTGAKSNLETINVKVVGYENSLGDYINDTRLKIRDAENYFANVTPEIFEFYDLLGFNDIIDSSKNNLNLLENEFRSLGNETNQSRYTRIYDSVRNLRNVIPSRINVKVEEQNIYPLIDDINRDIVSKYSKDSVNEVYNYNKDLLIQGKIVLVEVTYIGGADDSYVVVKKELNFDDNYLVVEDLSDVVNNIELVNVINGGATQDKENIALLFENLGGGEIAYSYKGDDITSYGKTFLLRANKEDVINEVECGDNICSESETADSCPVDCRKVKINWILYIIILFVVLIIYYLFFTDGPGNLKRFIKKENSSEEKSSLFNNTQDFYNLKNYINQSLAKGIKKDKIILVLLRQGWTRKQIDYAFKKKKI